MIAALVSAGAEASLFLQAQALIKRTYLLKDIGLEIFFSGRNSLYLTFKTSEDRDRIAGKLESLDPSTDNSLSTFTFMHACFQLKPSSQLLLTAGLCIL